MKLHRDLGRGRPNHGTSDGREVLDLEPVTGHEWICRRAWTIDELEPGAAARDVRERRFPRRAVAAGPARSVKLEAFIVAAILTGDRDLQRMFDCQIRYHARDDRQRSNNHLRALGIVHHI